MSDFPSINDLLPKSQSKPVNDIKNTQVLFDKKIKQMDINTKEELVKQKSAQIGLPHIDLSSFPVSSDALRIIPLAEAQAKGVVCFFYIPGEIRLGCLELNENVEEMVDKLNKKYHANINLYLISLFSLEKVLALYGNLPIIKPISKDINITDEDLQKFQDKITDFRDLTEHFANVPITDILTLLIAAALKVKASDVHVEAEEDGIAMRYRIDGVLQNVATLPKEQWRKFISRIKLLAALKINITDRPQDGRVTLQLSKGSLDVRVSTMPTIYGESVVMRILYGGAEQVNFDLLGLRGKAYEDLKREISRPNGMIITTGPTGSGKTTTMYSILKLLNKPGVKIITLEDPVEIKMEGINQSQVDQEEKYTFAKGLKSILRQDPDICMVGEIRDLETAEISIQAALTGHLMLSTIHTNDASGAIPRFLSMGVKPFLLAPSLNSVIGQRLVRKICPDCMELEKLDEALAFKVAEHLNSLSAEIKEKIDLVNPKFYHGRGCEKCSGLGYKGRIGIYEIFTMNKEIEAVILSQKVSEYTIKEMAIKSGMITMVQDGLLKALDKITSVEEIFRVTE
ncbi:MAG: hypothetical protein COU31_03565 [Candidatus Magasanikbacteria bacterium CG10_big_fil_rev_8_21_14_0_10_40_10]|uniref:AAA+ ATPase domain-containing protein n=1 Tax=Candidatus Magasanikbacteria bacterium CG10_big_fil_rev_8_21_14_0_10_40_10 TaxID=1974648 RepID=A0A2M6W3H2_9BACT|nr:MAG: hypothetical protein COU31_03565 [Candidatus Magasanikbacteria bacterium CG10_big_fil_rev_8_21_14_0_10_40_10]